MSQPSQQLELDCQIENHQSIIKYVCLDQNCSKLRLICDKCLQFEIHKGHQKQVNLKDAKLHFDQQIQQNQKLENYLQSLCISIPELIQRLKHVINAQNSIKFTLSPQNNQLQNNQLLDKIVKFEKISNHITTTMKKISDTYVGEIKKLIELANANSSKQQTFGDNQNDKDQKQDVSDASSITKGESPKSITQIIQQNIELQIQIDLSTKEEKCSIDHYIQQAESLKIQEKYNESIYYYNKGLDFDQKNLICWRGIGDCLRLIEEFLEAIPYYDKALYIEQNDIPSLIGKGECLRMLQDYEESKKCYEQVVNIDEKNIVSRVGLGECLRHLGSFLQAIGQYDKALEMDQKNLISLYGKGYCLRNIHKYEQATDCYKKVLEIDKNHISSKREHDLCLQELNKNKMLYYSQVNQNTDEQQENVIQTDIIPNRGAIKVYHISNSRDPNQEFNKSFQVLPNKDSRIQIKRSESFDRKQVRDYCTQADTLKQNGNYEEALELYEKALEKDPKDIPSLNGKANCLRLLHKFEESLQTLETAIKFNRNSISLYGKGECLRMLKQFQDAEEFYNESLKKAKEESQYQDPIIFMNLRGLGDILRAKGEFQKSIELYDQALSLNEKHALSLFGKAESLRGLAKYEDSIAYYKKSLEINKNDLISLSGIGESLRIQKNYREAQKYYEKALKIDKDQVVCLRGLSQCLRKQFQPIKALELINKVLTISPYDEKCQILKEICLREIKQQEQTLNNQGNNS